MSQFNCLCKWMNTQSFPGTGLCCVLGSPEDLQEKVTLVPGHSLIWMLCLCSTQNKRPEVDSRREQQTLAIQFLTFLMSNSKFFLSSPKRQGFLHFLELRQSVGIHIGVKYQDRRQEANMVGPRKNCEMRSHTSAPPQHISPSSRLLFPPKVAHVLGILIQAHVMDGKYMPCVALLLACCAYGRHC